MRVVGHEAFKNEWYIVTKVYKFTVFEILSYIVFPQSLHIESTDSIIEHCIG